MTRVAALLAGCVAVSGGLASAAAQAVTGHSPNVRGEWRTEAGQLVFVLNHRFEIMSGGDELISIPTLTLGTGLPWRLAGGLDFTSNSEIVPGRLGGNEVQFWVAAPLLRGESHGLAATLAYNRAARSADGALTARTRLSSFTLLGELRGFSNFLGTPDAGAAGAVGTVLHLTPYLQLAGDVGRALTTDTLDVIWSGGIAVRIPGTPHTFSLHATNAGAVTLQGVSRQKVIGPQRTRYGFAFTVPLGTRAQWARIFRREAAPPPVDTAASRVDMRMIAFTPGEVRIRAGEAVAWINMDPVDHTVTARDGTWRSGLMQEGERYVRVFTEPGRYEYYCEPHPQMTGVVIVEEGG